MVKHVPTFKHLVATSQSKKSVPTRERTVNERLSSLRAAAHAVPAIPLHVIGSGQRVWTPGESSIPPGVDIGPGGESVHPAELLRRQQVERREASRSVAGPAPPPSWHASGPSPRPQDQPDESPGQAKQVTGQDLQRASEFFPFHSRPTRVGARRLMEHCFLAVLECMNSTQPLSGVVDDEGRVEYTVGEVMCEQVAYMEGHLKAGLLDVHSLLPAGHPRRLTDAGMKAVLSLPLDGEVPHLTDEGDWEDVRDASGVDVVSTLHHLALTVHRSPTVFLRQIPSFPAIFLTSLNLAYSTVSDLDRMVHVLPSGLRDLSLRGVRVRGGDHTAMERESWQRGLSLLGRKMIVLRSLDLSEPPLPLGELHLVKLLRPPATHLPSLRKLGFGGGTADGSADMSVTVKGDDTSEAFTARAERKRIVDTIRGGGRKRFVEVVWVDATV